MAYEITHIRLKNGNSQAPEDITDVKLSNGYGESKQRAIHFIDSGYSYYYTTSTCTRAEVESVHPSDREAFIRTKGNQMTQDNLLSLPRF